MSWCWKYGGKNGNGDKLSILQHKGNAKKISVGANIPIGTGTVDLYMKVVEEQ